MDTMYRRVANKNGTIEINGNTFRFSQPADEYKTDDVQKIEESYSKKLEYIADDPNYITARDIENRNGQITSEYNLTDLKMFDYLRTLFLKEKLVYYKSLIEIAKRDEKNEVSVLWQKENFVIDPIEKNIKTLIIEHDVFRFHERKDTVKALKEFIILSLTSMNRVLGKPRRADFLEQKEEVIQFAEKIYFMAETIEAIEEIVNAELRHLEMQEKEEGNKQGKLSVVRKGLESKLADKARENMISKLNNEPQGSPTTKKKEKLNNNKLIFGVVGVILAAVILSNLLTNATEEKQASADAEVLAIQESEKMIDIYRDALFDDKESTVEKLEEIGYENLGESDQEALNRLYIDTGNYDTAMENDSGLVGEIAEKLYQNEEYESLDEFVNGLEEKNHEASFYLELANENWQEVKTLKDAIALDEEQVNYVLTAYFQLEDVVGAEEFLFHVDNVTEKMQERLDLANEIKGEIRDAESELDELEKKLDNTDKKEDKQDIEKEIENVTDDIKSLKNELKSV